MVWAVHLIMKSYGEYIPIRSCPPGRMQAYDWAGIQGNLDGDVQILLGLALAKLRGGNTSICCLLFPCFSQLSIVGSTLSVPQVGGEDL